MKKIYTTPKERVINLDMSAMLMQGSDTETEVFPDDIFNDVGNKNQLVKGHSAWDDEW